MMAALSLLPSVNLSQGNHGSVPSIVVHGRPGTMDIQNIRSEMEELWDMLRELRDATTELQNAG